MGLFLTMIIYMHSLKRYIQKCHAAHTRTEASWYHFCLISLPLCPLLLSFAAVTFQSSTCSPPGGSAVERNGRRETCPLWEAKRLPFERSNPLHHISHNLLSFPITLWESISASSSHPAPLFSISLPVVFTSPVSYCCLTAFNPTHHSTVLCKAFVFASTMRHLRKHANGNTNDKRQKSANQVRTVFICFRESAVLFQAQARFNFLCF